MKKLILVAMLVAGCMTNRYAYQEAESCPMSMDEDQFQSGVVRCKAQCSSVGRDFAAYTREDCKCWCQTPMGGGYRKSAPKKQAPNTNQM